MSNDLKQFVLDYEAVKEAVNRDDMAIMLQMAEKYKVFTGCCGGRHPSVLKQTFIQWLHINYEQYESGKKQTSN